MLDWFWSVSIRREVVALIDYQWTVSWVVEIALVPVVSTSMDSSVWMTVVVEGR